VTVTGAISARKHHSSPRAGRGAPIRRRRRPGARG
jgi:hypothetical protein